MGLWDLETQRSLPQVRASEKIATRKITDVSVEREWLVNSGNKGSLRGSGHGKGGKGGGLTDRKGRIERGHSSQQSLEKPKDCAITSRLLRGEGRYLVNMRGKQGKGEGGYVAWGREKRSA